MAVVPRIGFEFGAGRHVLEVGRDHVARVIDAEDQLASTFEPSAWGPPWVTSGMKLVIPPVPVLPATPGAGPLEPCLDRELGKVELGRDRRR